VLSQNNWRRAALTHTVPLLAPAILPLSGLSDRLSDQRVSGFVSRLTRPRPPAFVRPAAWCYSIVRSISPDPIALVLKPPGSGHRGSLSQGQSHWGVHGRVDRTQTSVRTQPRILVLNGPAPFGLSSPVSQRQPQVRRLARERDLLTIRIGTLSGRRGCQRLRGTAPRIRRDAVLQPALIWLRGRRRRGSSITVVRCDARQERQRCNVSASAQDLSGQGSLAVVQSVDR